MWRKQEVAVLTSAYQALPGGDHEKARFQAVLLRLRIERVVMNLPALVTRSTWPSHVRCKLLVSVGEPGLSQEQQDRRFWIVWRAARAYQAICDVIHGRHAGLYPALQDLASWSRDIELLEEEFRRESDSRS